MKQSIEKNLGQENVVIDIPKQMSKDDVNNITYFARSAAAEDWDLSDNVGWSQTLRPIYLSPSVIKPSSGESTKTYLGLGTNNAAAQSWYERMKNY